VARSSSKVIIRNSSRLGWMTIKNAKKQTFTVQNYAYRFTSSKSPVYVYDEDQTVTTNWNVIITPAGIISIYGDAENVALLLSRMAHGNLWDSFAKNPTMFQLGSVKITAEQVLKEVKRCLGSGAYRREGKRVISLFWVVDTFLEREKLNENSRWITVVMGKSGADLKPYMKDTSEKLMLKHLRSVLDSREAELKQELKEEILKELAKKQKKG